MKIKHFCCIVSLAIVSTLIINKAFAEYKVYSYSSGYGSNYEEDYNDNQETSKTTEYSSNTNNFSSNMILATQPVPLSYKSKAEVFALRKEAVSKSIFKNSDYQPSTEVFGQIEDGKPWVSMNSCVLQGDERSVISGPSEESRFILNPTALVMINYPFSNWCSVGENKPHENISAVSYNENKNEIIVTYDMLYYSTLSNNAFYEFQGLNARDLGYKYAYVDTSKSTFELNFVNSNNIGNSVVEFQNFLHTGGSCKHASGCNNGSPFQPMLHFENPHVDNTPYQYNKEIYIKLWKNKPNSKYDTPDIVERIIFKKA